MAQVHIILHIRGETQCGIVQYYHDWVIFDYNTQFTVQINPWWRHDIGTLSTLLAFSVRGYPTSHKGQDVNIWCFLCGGLKLPVEETVEVSVIWDTMTLVRRYYIICTWITTVYMRNQRKYHAQYQYPDTLGLRNIAWWRHQMETFSALPTICAGNSPVTGEFPAQRPVTRSFDGFFDLRLNKLLSKQSWGWWFWFETLSRPLWRHCNDTCFLKWTVLAVNQTFALFLR